MLRAKVSVMLKQGIFDPQRRAVQNGLESIGFEQVTGVRVGKQLEIDLAFDDREALGRYAVHPEHQRVLKILRETVTNILAVDFETD